MSSPRALEAPEHHRLRHVKLHEAFDELLADFLLNHPGKRPGNSTIQELLIWSFRQTMDPDANKARSPR
jgi:hypothetical protein